jgi:hypothetical protein
VRHVCFFPDLHPFNCFLIHPNPRQGALGSFAGARFAGGRSAKTLFWLNHPEKFQNVPFSGCQFFQMSSYQQTLLQLKPKVFVNCFNSIREEEF